MNTHPWSQFYNDYGRFYLLPHTGINKFVNLCHKFGYTKILDMGCGSGRHIVELAGRGFDVTGIDLSPSAAQLAESWLNQKNLKGQVIVGDFDDEVPDFEDNTFQAILAVNSLEYGEEGELDYNLLQINRLLKSKGLIFLVFRSKETTLKHVDVPIQFLDEESLRKKINIHFKILDFSQDNDKNFVIYAQKKS